MSEPLDLFVIGGGSGGVAAARRAASYGAKVAICEASRLGGTCVVRGCVPKKLMHYGATVPHMVETARGYGWSIPDPVHAWEAFLEARNKEIARLEGIYQGMLDKVGVERITGYGKVAGRDGELFVVEVGERRWHTKRVLLAAGARPVVPEVPGIEHTVTSDELLEQTYPFPKRVAVVGAGYIGVEMASIFNGFGAETTIVLRGEMPLRGFDDDLRSELVAQMSASGVRLLPQTEVDRIEKTSTGLALVGAAVPLEVDAVLYATGRRAKPNTGKLGLDTVGVRTDAEGAIHVDMSYETNIKGIFGVGDCADHGGNALVTGGFDLTPVAIAEGRAFAERVFNNNPRLVEYEAVPTAVFADPELSTVGMSENSARDLGYDVSIFRTRFRPLRYTLTGGERKTLMKLVVDKDSDRVLGCHMVGDDAAEIIQGFAVAVGAGATKRQFDATVALHPTAAEEFVTMHQPVA